MDLREHHFGPIAVPKPGTDRFDVDVGALVRRLILFERCTVESIRLTEIPALVAAFGADGLLELLDSGSVGLVCDVLTVGQVGHIPWLRTSENRGGPLPHGSYRLATIETGDRRAYVHGALQEVHKTDLPFKDAKRLKRALASRLLKYPPAAGEAAINDVQRELARQHPVVWDAIRAAVLKETGLDPGPDPELRIHPLEQDGDFRIETTLNARLGLPPMEEHRLVEQGLLALAGLDQRLRLMEAFEAVSGFRENEVRLFEQKMRFILSQVDASVQERRFSRVITLGGLPSLDALPAGARVDAGRLLRLRESAECQQLRVWLRGIDAESDDQIVAAFGGVRDAIAAMTQSPLGRKVRFLAMTGVGSVPLVGPLIGTALSAADAFLVDRLLGKAGPAAFLGRHYPSIFLSNPASEPRQHGSAEA